MNSKDFYIGERVICSESGVVGDVIKFYKPTASEEQIMVRTLDGRKYHAPARTWKPYQFGFTARQFYKLKGEKKDENYRFRTISGDQSGS